MTDEKPKEIRYFSMFTGVGGFDLAFERANDLRRIQQKTSKGTNSENNSEKRGMHDGGKFSCVKQTNDLSKGKGAQQGGNEIDLSNNEQESFSTKQFTCVGFSEIDKYCNQVLKERFPNIKNYGDATKIDPNELPEFDMLCGGFPCQAFSVAGKRRGFQDTRGTLFFEIARILKVKRPKLVLLENVKGLLNHEEGRTFGIIIQTLSELGYDVQWMVLNSKFFGVPQNRERVFIIGSLRGEHRPEILPFKETNGKFLKTRIFYKITGETPSGISRQGERIYEKEGISPTLTSQFGEVGVPKIKTTNLGDDIVVRRLTPIECERVQGFPDNWTLVKQDNGKMMSNNQRYKMCGNAVTVNVIQAIGEKLI